MLRLISLSQPLMHAVEVIFKILKYFLSLHFRYLTTSYSYFLIWKCFTIGTVSFYQEFFNSSIFQSPQLFFEKLFSISTLTFSIVCQTIIKVCSRGHCSVDRFYRTSPFIVSTAYTCTKLWHWGGLRSRACRVIVMYN